MKRSNHRLRGMTSVLAMLFLVLFSTLAIGFYAATNTQSQIVSNDERVAKALLACESGMDFMRYQLGRVNIPGTVQGEAVLPRLYSELSSLLHGTPNLGSSSIELTGNTIRIPAGNGTIPLDSTGHSRFRATVTDWLGEIVVKVEGSLGTTSASRAISMDFTRAQRQISAFDYAVASKGQVVMTGGTITSQVGVDPAIATVMSAMESGESIKISGGTIGGDLNVTGQGTVSLSGSPSVAGKTNHHEIMNQHVHVVDKPVFPEFDTGAYRAFATNVRTTGANGPVTLTNVRIPPNTNPKFNGNATIQGILYIQAPNKVEFKGNFTLNGFIVFEGSGQSSENTIEFSGSMTQGPLPNSPEFDALRATSGVAILAPTAKILMTGAAKGNMRGSIISSQFETKGNPFEIIIDQGTLMTLDEGPSSAVFGAKTIRFSSTGSSNIPTTGVIYSTYYQPNPISYQEVSP